MTQPYRVLVSDALSEAGLAPLVGRPEIDIDQKTDLTPAQLLTEIGAYDGLFHDHGEAMTQWYVTNDALIYNGNLAVTEAGSNLIDFRESIARARTQITEETVIDCFTQSARWRTDTGRTGAERGTSRSNKECVG